VARELEDGTVRAVSVKTARTGFTESRRILDVCAARGIPVVVGSQYEGALGALASIAFAAAFAETASRPVEASNFHDLAADLLAERPRIEDGYVTVPPAAGLGYVIDGDALAAHRVEG
jgi:L-alanine-DL-glutamate epimerase-like enolase superfamily enzyme